MKKKKKSASTRRSKRFAAAVKQKHGKHGTPREEGNETFSRLPPPFKRFGREQTVSASERCASQPLKVADEPGGGLLFRP